jgi:hypothetical protein
MKHFLRTFFFPGVLIAFPLQGLVAQSALKPGESVHGLRKIKDIMIYQDSLFYAAFPSVVKRPNREFLVAFRRAPNLQAMGEKNYEHIDPNSYLVTIRSRDGEVWTKNPDLLYAHPFGGSQDPCLLQLRDGSLICTSYGWRPVSQEAYDKLEKPVFYSIHSKAIFLGGYVLRSTDGGHQWKGPFYPMRVPIDPNLDIFGNPLPAYNRGGLWEAKDGRILWVVAAGNEDNRGSAHLLVSRDKGLSWKYSSVVAEDEKAEFNEASVLETPGGDLVVFLRTANYDDQACIARSKNGGKSFSWQGMGFKGHPLHALPLPDKRVLITYGYRHKPFGIRARILNAECTDFATAPEIILRDDGGGTDLGYTWSVLLNNNRVLVCYYFNIDAGLRHIAGTIIEIK